MISPSLEEDAKNLKNILYEEEKISNKEQTIIDYIANLRVDEAKNLLLNTNMSVNDIALNVGYLNSSSFIRRFKQITGLTPVQFIKANKKTQNTE